MEFGIFDDHDHKLFGSVNQLGINLMPMSLQYNGQLSKSSAEDSPKLTMKRMVVSRIPTKNGECQVYLYKSSRHPDKEHMAFVYGDLDIMQHEVLTRVHSECFTGEVMGSLRCDCQEQLHTAQAAMAKEGGVIVYLRQEGRGIGLFEKLKAYNLQDEGFDTVDANLALGHQADARTYDEAALILEDLEIKSVKLMTNNTEKVAKLAQHGIRVVGRVPMKPKIITQDNLAYLTTKIERMHHLLELPVPTSEEEVPLKKRPSQPKNFESFQKPDVAQPTLHPVPQNYFF